MLVKYRKPPLLDNGGFEMVEMPEGAKILYHESKAPPERIRGGASTRKEDRMNRTKKLYHN